MIRSLKSAHPFRKGFQKGFREDIRKGKLPFYLALGYLIWSLFPHAAFRIHEHEGGSAAHSHLSFHDAGLKVGSTVAANPPEWASGVSEPAEPVESMVSAASAAHPQSFKPENPRHGHFTEDDNIVSAGITISRAPLTVVHPVPVPAPVLSPLLPYSGPATARGPPSRV